jgi:hypothetical protein
MSEPSGGTYYRFKDSSGVDHLVDSLSAIPNEYRQKAEKVDLKDIYKEAKQVQKEVSGVVPFVADLDLPSMAVGFAFALLAFLVLTFMWKTGKMLLKVGLLFAIVVFVGGAYFGWLRRAAGVGTEALAHPAQLLKDAKDSTEKMNKALKDEERVLKKIESDR